MFLAPIYVHADSGTEGASFLNIPVGAEPAALGGAYSALATDAYAPALNPGGLGRVDGFQLAAQHLAYLQSINYEYASFVCPFQGKRAFGASVQYLGTGDLQATDNFGNTDGSFTSRYGAYAFSYGQTVTSKLSLGVTGKIVEAKIDNVSAHALAADIGSHYQATDKLTLAGVLTNAGGKMKFIEQADPLPLAFHAGGAYRASPVLTFSIEGVYRQNGLASLQAGIEWRPVSQFAFRAGYRTDTIKDNSSLAGISLGAGFNIFGQTLSYAWVPMGDLGNTQYVSILIRLGGHSKNQVTPSQPQQQIASKPVPQIAPKSARMNSKMHLRD